MSIGILGGTGPAGRALAARLSSTGTEVHVGSREKERGEQVAAALRDTWPDRDLPLRGVQNEKACTCDLVVIATPWQGAVPTASALRQNLAGKVVVSMVNALEMVGREMQALVPPRGSITAAVQHAVPDALVAGAFHHVPAAPLGDLTEDLEGDVLVCSDHERAMTAAIELVDSVPGLRGVNGGSLTYAAAVEAFTAVLVGVNMRYRAHSSIRLTGIDR